MRFHGGLGVLQVEHFELIRRMVLVEDVSAREAARRLGHSRKTILKAIKHSSPVPYTLSQPKPRPKLEPYLPMIRQWLIDDQQKPRKQRHTAMRVWERLRDEHQFTGKRRNVSDVVSRIRRELVPPEVFVPINHPAGEEFQIDWGEATIHLNGNPTIVMIFCARSAYSKATFVRAYLRDDLISFLDAHVWLLSQLGGVPKRLAYDNLSSAVVSIGPKGQRVLNRKFLELRSHYLFETRFCNVARGNEKGRVENSVKRAERTYLTPVPSVTSLEQLNQHLLKCCADDLDRRCHQSQRTYRELLAEERPLFRELPPQPFVAASSRSQKVDRQSTIKCANARYSVPITHACLPVVVRSFVDRVEIFRKEQLIASHPRAEPGESALKIEHYLPVLERKPGLLDSGLPFVASAWNESQLLPRRELEFRLGEEGTRQFLSIVLLAKEHPWNLVCEAIQRAVGCRAFHEQAVRLELQQIVNGPSQQTHSRPFDTSHYPALTLDSTGVRDLSIYDAVLNPAIAENQSSLAP
jgi:transposase